MKRPESRASYAQLLVRVLIRLVRVWKVNSASQEHPFLANEVDNTVDMPAWVASAVAWREAQREREREAALARSKDGSQKDPPEPPN
jgi:hypothetical protein